MLSLSSVDNPSFHLHSSFRLLIGYCDILLSSFMMCNSASAQYSSQTWKLSTAIRFSLVRIFHDIEANLTGLGFKGGAVSDFNLLSLGSKFTNNSNLNFYPLIAIHGNIIETNTPLSNLQYHLVLGKHSKTSTLMRLKEFILYRCLWEIMKYFQIARQTGSAYFTHCIIKIFKLLFADLHIYIGK